MTSFHHPTLFTIIQTSPFITYRISNTKMSAQQNQPQAAAGGSQGGAQQAGAQQGGGGGGHGGGLPPDPAIIAAHKAFTNYLLIVCGSVACALLVWRLYTLLLKKVRHVACLHNEKQRYFAIPDRKLSFIKKHALYAPVFRKRHNREIQMSSAVNFGTLPTRLEFLFLIGYFATNVVFSLVGVPFTGEEVKAASTFRDRTGILSVINMVRQQFPTGFLSRVFFFFIYFTLPLMTF